MLAKIFCIKEWLGVFQLPPSQCARLDRTAPPGLRMHQFLRRPFLPSPCPARQSGGWLWIINKTLFPSDSDNSVLILGSNRAKDGAISPRLANRYSRFALSHSSCYYDSHRVREWEQRVERSQLAHLFRMSLRGFRKGGNHQLGNQQIAPTRIPPPVRARLPV